MPAKCSRRRWSATNVGGFCLFGSRTGRYPFDPHVIYRFRDDALPDDWHSDENLARDVRDVSETRES